MQANRALDAALALARNPGLAASMRSRPLPSGIPLLLQILADESEVALSVAQALRVNERSLRFAVEHYVETVMLFAGAEPTRVLGVATDATRAEMRTHLRWLMRWLHPDHNPAAWRSAFAGRVLTAWREASSPDAVANAPQRRPRGEARRSGRPGLPVYPLRLAWIAYPLKEERRINWRRASARTGLCLVLVTLASLVLSEALPERVGSGLRELSAALRMFAVIDSSETLKNGEAIDGPGGAL
jgi:hypothetical protein